MTIAVAISGGTDSMYALLTLKEAGHKVFGLHAHFLAPDPAREAALADMCRQLGVPFHAVDLHEEFERCVVDRFIASYQAGDTPNPCALCNASMKFGALLREAEKLGANTIATGHYAILEDHPQYGRTLAKGDDPAKDQSYFLSLVPKSALEKAVFPLGRLTKDAIRKELTEKGLTPPYPSESQEICFVPDDDYRKFLKDRNVSLKGGGKVTLTDGTVVGSHNGLWQYTEGQRRGLGISWKEPLYVVGKNSGKNILVVGSKEEQLCRGCTVQSLNFLVPHEKWPEQLLVRTRFRQKPQPASVSVNAADSEKPSAEGSLSVTFATMQGVPAAGQVCCIYDCEYNVLGGGLITGVF